MRSSSKLLVLAQCILGLGLVVALNRPSRGESPDQPWLDRLTLLVDQYAQLAEETECVRAVQDRNKAIASREEDDSSRGEARLDCLANRLLEEEYQPYDFDIRETSWCKDQLLTANWISTPASSPSDRLPVASDLAPSGDDRDALTIDFGPALAWLDALHMEVWVGFTRHLRNQLDGIASRSETLVASAFDFSHRMGTHLCRNRLVVEPSIREVFGHHLIPDDISLAQIESTVRAVEGWTRLRNQSAWNGILIQSTWYQMQNGDLKPFYDLITSIPEFLRTTQR